MRTILDAAALIGLMRAEPSAVQVASALRAQTAVIVAINLSETIDILIRREQVAETEARKAIGRLTSSVLGVVAVDEALAWRAALIRTRRYHRTHAALSVNDCMCLAAAGGRDVILTSDLPLLRAAREEGIAIKPLPDSTGQTPRP